MKVRSGSYLLFLPLLGCAAAPPPSPTVAPPTVSAFSEPDFLDERALLLLLADRRSYEPFAVTRFLGAEPPLRRALAASLGRIGDSRGRPPLEALLGDPDQEVRRDAAFYLGVLGMPEAATALKGATRDPDPETGRLAVEALGKLEVPLLEVVEVLGPLPEEDRWRRLLPSLFRFPEPAAVPVAEEGWRLSDPVLRRWALYGVARTARAEAEPLYREAISDRDPWIRGWGARALGSVGSDGVEGVLVPLLEDPEPGVVIEALRALARIVGENRASPPERVRTLLPALLEHPDPGVRVTAIEVASHWLRDEGLAEALAGLVRRDPGHLGDEALRSLAAGEEPVASDLVSQAIVDPRATRREAAARAAERLGFVALVDGLAGDPSPRVRAAVLELRLEREEEAEAAIRGALVDADPVVRAVGLGWLSEHPVVSDDALWGAVVLSRPDRILDARVAAIDALRARAEAVSLERGGIILRLEALVQDPELQVRRAAIVALKALGQTGFGVGQVETGRNLDVYRDIVLQSARSRSFLLRTDGGLVRLELACPQAPLTCVNFAQLVRNGFYDGLVFHRVVPGFVVQAGDPRGDGWGGPGYAIRDEINRLRYDTGTLGMALSGPDTGGSQFFVTLAPQPHLDGGYTAFGRVVEGQEVLASLVQGDRILSIEEVGGP